MDEQEVKEQDYEREFDPYDDIDWEEHERQEWWSRWRDEHPFNQHDFLQEVDDMNDPIISPWTIYLIDIVDSLGVFLLILSVTIAIFGTGFLLVSCDNVCESRFGVSKLAKKFQ